MPDLAIFGFGFAIFGVLSTGLILSLREVHYLQTHSGNPRESAESPARNKEDALSAK